MKTVFQNLEEKIAAARQEMQAATENVERLEALHKKLRTLDPEDVQILSQFLLETPVPPVRQRQQRMERSGTIAQAIRDVLADTERGLSLAQICQDNRVTSFAGRYANNRHFQMNIHAALCSLRKYGSVRSRHDAQTSKTVWSVTEQYRKTPFDEPTTETSVQIDGFIVVIERGQIGYGARVPLLPGVIAVGSTYEEVERRIREAIPLHMKALSDSGAYPN